LYNGVVAIIYPLVHNRYKVDFVVCACPYGRIKMSCIINQGPLSDYVILEKRSAWREDIMVLNTTLDGKTIKLSEELAKDIHASQYCKEPFCTQFKNGINVKLWMKYGRIVSKICFIWFDKQRSQELTCWATGETVGEGVVITSFD